MKDVESHFALSPLQEGILFHCLVEADPELYCSQLAWSIEGDLDTHAFVAAWQALVDRHATLRTFLLWERVRQPKQVVLRQVSLSLQSEDWSGLDDAEQHARWEALLQSDRATGFRLDRAPLFRVTLVSLSPRRHYFLWTRHHVLMDGWSAALLLRELFEVYPRLSRGLPCAMAAVKPYEEYVGWLKVQDRQAGAVFWESYLRGFDAATPLPFEDPSAGGRSALATGYWELPAEIDRGLAALTRVTGLTAASMISAAWGLALAQLTGRDDVVFGTTVSGRPAAIDGVTSIVGLFINTIPVRVHPRGNQPVRQWLEAFQRELSTTRQHELLPLVDIQSCSAVSRGAPLFQTLLVVENFPSLADHEQVVDGLRIEPIVEFSRNSYPLTVMVRLSPRLSVEIAADASRLDGAAIEHVGRRFENVLTRIVREVDAPLAALVRTHDHDRSTGVGAAVVERRALPPPDAPQPGRPPDGSHPLEELIGAVWANVLGTAAPAAGDDFFALGGHSLLATRVIVALRRTLEIDIPIRALFEHPTLAAFTTYVRTIGPDARTVPSALMPRPRSDVAPLSFAQQRLWLLDQLAPGNASYHTRRCMRIRGVLLPADLKRSLEYITARHEVLRSVIEPGDSDPRQRVLPAVDVPFAVVDLSHLPRDPAFARIEEHAVAESRRAFDLARGPLLRATLYRLADDDWMLLVVMHHIVSDGWSSGVFVRELAACYRALRAGQAPELPPLPVQYADFAVWQRNWLRGDTLSRQLEYWRAQLDGIATLRLPTDFPRTSVPSFDGATVPVVFSAEVSERLLRLSREESVTPFMIALGLVQVLLHRITGDEDIAIGTSVANRIVPEIEPLIGFFVNTLVMRGRVSSRTSFRALLADARRQSVGAFMHQDIPFERLVEELQPRRDPARNPFFQVSLAFQNAPEVQVEIPGLALEPWAAPGVATRFDLEFHVLVHAGRLHWEIYYNTALFHAETVRRFAAALERIAEEVVAAPDRPVGRIPLTSVAPVAEPAPALPFVSMLSSLERWAREHGDRPAVIDDTRRLDYQGLRRRAALWARHLRAHHVARGDRIGLAFRAGADTITGIYAAFMAGCAYVPLDASQPPGRLERMCASAGLVTVLSDDAATAFARVVTAEQLDMPADADRPPHEHVPEDEAYVIFTSGSTGAPKGVVVTHGNLASSTRARERYYGSPPTAFLLLSSFAFDSSVAGIFWTLASGGTLVVASADARRDPREIGRLLVSHRITHTLCLPSLYQALLQDLPAHRQLALESVIVAGEPCSNELLEQHARLLPGVRLFNEYGPTEGTVWATVEDCVQEPRGAAIAIGRPIPGACCHVLDEAFFAVPDGFFGQLYIGGPGVATGYAREAGLTASRFVPDPFGSGPGSRLYATGDLVRRGVGGALEFFGRADHQIKIRGHRIELGEIEVMLRTCATVADCCVTAREDDGETRLAGYVQWTREALKGSADEALRGWQDVFEHEYERTTGAADPEQDFVGWVSRYTGQPIPHVEMSAWLRETVGRILALSPRAIVEVGCGNGLLMLALAPHCERVAGSDASESAIRRLRAEVERRGLHHVTLDRGMAHEVSDAGPAPDLVVMNSVVQYFPGVEYLEGVLDRCLRVLAPGGRIFLGDIRHFDLLPLFHASVEADRSGGRHGGDLLSRVREQLEEETELALSPLYFADLKRRRPELQRVRILPKLFDADNELSLFRYDVVLETAAPPVSADVEWRDWPAGWTSDDYRDWLMRECPAIAAFRNVPHAALEREFARVTTGSAAVDRDAAGLRPREFAALSEAAGYTVEVSWAGGDERGRFDVVCTRRGVVETADVTVEVLPSSGRLLANDPSAALRSNRLLVQLRQFAAERLAAVMLPTLWTAMRRLPRTATGKLDRAALPIPRDVRPAPRTYRPPVNAVQEVMVGIWAAVLRRTQLGIDDNFFDLGGHSLMATQVVSRVREAFNVEVSLGTLFRAPTVEAFAAALVNECRDAREIEIRARILLKVWAAGPAASASQSAEMVAL